MQKIWGTSGPNLERSKIQPLQWSYCKHFWAHRDQIWSALRFNLYNGHIANIFGHIGTKFGALLDSTSTKVILQKIWGTSEPKSGAHQNSTSTKVILQKIWGISGPNLERSKIPAPQRSYCKKIWGTSGPNFECTMIPPLQWSIAKNLGHIRTKSGACQNSTSTKVILQKI